MKRITSIFVLFVMLGYSFLQIGTFMEYIVDIESYTEKYCVNKSTPEKQCHGKCHLTEELAKNEKENQKHKILSAPEILLFQVEKTVEISEQNPIMEKEKPHYHYKPLFIEDLFYSIFQPPRV